MKENQLLLTSFVNEDRFELHNYLTSLFDYFASLSKQETADDEKASD